MWPWRSALAIIGVLGRVAGEHRVDVATPGRARCTSGGRTWRAGRRRRCPSDSFQLPRELEPLRRRGDAQRGRPGGGRRCTSKPRRAGPSHSIERAPDRGAACRTRSPRYAPTARRPRSSEPSARPPAVVAGERQADEAAVVGVRPAVVRAREALGAPASPSTTTIGAAMGAAVEHGVDVAVASRGDDDRPAADGRGDEVAGAGRAGSRGRGSTTRRRTPGSAPARRSPGRCTAAGGRGRARISPSTSTIGGRRRSQQEARVATARSPSAGTSEDLGRAAQPSVADELVDLATGERPGPRRCAARRASSGRAGRRPRSSAGRATPRPRRRVRTHVDGGCWAHADGSPCQRHPLGQPPAVVEVQRLVGGRVGVAAQRDPEHGVVGEPVEPGVEPPGVEQPGLARPARARRERVRAAGSPAGRAARRRRAGRPARRSGP